MTAILVVAGVVVAHRPHQDLTQQYDFFPVKQMDLSEKVEATGSVVALAKKDLAAVEVPMVLTLAPSGSGGALSPNRERTPLMSPSPTTNANPHTASLSR